MSDHRTLYRARAVCATCAAEFVETGADSATAVTLARMARDAHESLHRGPEVVCVSHRFGGPS